MLFAGFSISRLPTPLVHKTTKSASLAWQADKDAHLCRRQLQAAAALGSGKKSAENSAAACAATWTLPECTVPTSSHLATRHPQRCGGVLLKGSGARKAIQKRLRLVPSLLAERGNMQSQSSAGEWLSRPLLRIFASCICLRALRCFTNSQAVHFWPLQGRCAATRLQSTRQVLWHNKAPRVAPSRLGQTKEIPRSGSKLELQAAPEMRRYRPCRLESRHRRSFHPETS